jgi:hypothetical protein
VVVVCLVSAAIAVGLRAWVKSRFVSHTTVRPTGTLTFNKDIAAIVSEHCSGCHRPGQSGPFNLLTCEDVRKRAKQIVDVTQRRYMPPWLPEPGYGDFVGERSLTADQIEVIRQWVAEGASEGNLVDLPPPREWNDGWQLGKPDLVLELPEAFMLPADGSDVYRNFVIPLSLAQRRYLRGIEFNPRSKAVHHAFIRFDRTDGSRRADAAEPGPGFGGIHMPPSVENPASQFLTWQPGKRPSLVSDDLVSPVEKGADLVLQLHLRPTGREESVQPELALFFGDKPPTSIASKILLGSMEIDIPPGASDRLVKDSFTLPVDVEVRAVLPHAHYLAKEIRAHAILPDGRNQWLLLIKNWDFNWQGDYRYAKPILLPRNSRIELEIHYDNSADNPRNPNHPPMRVRYGAESSDEMAELWLQVVLRSRADAESLMESTRSRFYRDKILFNQYVLRKNPNDARSHNELGRAFLMSDREVEAFREFQEAIRLQPDFDSPHYYLGILHRQRKEFARAQEEFQHALRINPKNSKAHGNLGLVFLEQGNLNSAESHFRSALAIDPDDPIARDSLAQVLEAKSNAGRPK